MTTKSFQPPTLPATGRPRQPPVAKTSIALITGGNKGIGRAAAEQLSTLGMTVVVGARDAAKGEAAAKELDAHSVVLDVTDSSSVAAAARFVEEKFGVLDVLVNNAGIHGVRMRPTEAEVDDVRGVFETNFFGVITVTNAFLPLLRRSSAARIVNVSSRVGSLTRHTDLTDYFARGPASAAYPASKTALNMLTVQYAKDLVAEGILVNAINPGACATDFIGTAVPGVTRTAADGARIIVKLATWGRDCPTGAVYDDDGRVPW
jgi:NAD(P)-dependent dehydrogenase (short-subunit alcohol dehydrogenase family)